LLVWVACAAIENTPAAQSNKKQGLYVMVINRSARGRSAGLTAIS
jgi:hypothetical protein